VLLINGLSDFVVEDAIILDECVLAMLIIPMKLNVDQEVYFVCGSTTTLGIGEEGAGLSVSARSSLEMLAIVPGVILFISVVDWLSIDSDVLSDDYFNLT